MKNHDKKLKALEAAALAKINDPEVDIVLLSPPEREKLKKDILRKICISDRTLIHELLNETAGEISQDATDAEYSAIKTRLEFFRSRWIEDSDKEALREFIIKILEKRFGYTSDNKTETVEILLFKQRLDGYSDLKPINEF